MRFLFVIIFFVVPIGVFADDQKISVNVEDEQYRDYVFDYPRGSRNNQAIIVKNLDSEDIELKIKMNSIEKSNGGLLGTVFYDDNLDAASVEILTNNKYDIVNFCEKDNSENISLWCKGNAELNFTLESDEEKRIPMVLSFTDDQDDHYSQLIISQKIDEEFVDVFVQELRYEAPDKDTKIIDLSSFSVEKIASGIDFYTWKKAGMKDQYRALYSVQNIGTENISYTRFINIKSLWVGEVIEQEQDKNIKSGGKEDDEIIVSMPRMGKVEVRGGVRFQDHNNQDVVLESQPIEIFIWPTHLVILLGIAICFCVICVLLYRYVKKNMFGRKKKKKTNNYAATYVVQDADNIISIAKRYNVSWKELAKNNDIEPPYILISGESINVPGGEGVGDEDQVDEKKVSNNRVITESAEEKEIDESNDVDDVVSIDEVEKNSISEKIEAQPLKMDGAKASDMQLEEFGQKNDIKENSIDESISEKKPKKRKVTFASPKNMLTQPSSEPTTRAIDIEWMRDDEAAYLEEMQVQEKKTNKRFFMIVGSIALVIILLIVLGVMHFMKNREQKSSVSVETMIEKDIEQLQKEQDQPDDLVDETSNGEMKGVVDSGENKDQEDEKEKQQEEDDAETTPESITIQVLNAGAQTGSAGTLSNNMKSLGYKINDAKNSQNDYQGVTIYYKGISEEVLSEIEKNINDKKDSIKKEESEEVTKKYSADVVIVLGS